MRPVTLDLDEEPGRFRWFHTRLGYDLSGNHLMQSAEHVRSLCGHVVIEMPGPEDPTMRYCPECLSFFFDANKRPVWMTVDEPRSW